MSIGVSPADGPALLGMADSAVVYIDISRNSSGSSWAESAVDPTRSQNIMVNWRRSASGAAGRD